MEISKVEDERINTFFVAGITTVILSFLVWMIYSL